MSLPPFGLEMAKCRISKRYQTEAIIQATLYSPEEAKKVGFIDEVVDETALEQGAKIWLQNMQNCQAKPTAK